MWLLDLYKELLWPLWNCNMFYYQWWQIMYLVFLSLSSSVNLFALSSNGLNVSSRAVVRCFVCLNVVLRALLQQLSDTYGWSVLDWPTQFRYYKTLCVITHKQFLFEKWNFWKGYGPYSCIFKFQGNIWNKWLKNRPKALEISPDWLNCAKSIHDIEVNVPKWITTSLERHLRVMLEISSLMTTYLSSW